MRPAPITAAAQAYRDRKIRSTMVPISLRVHVRIERAYRGNEHLGSCGDGGQTLSLGAEPAIKPLMSSTAAVARSGSKATMPARHLRALKLWLGALAALIVAMILIGGATRLTDSGLSITEWQPILGAIPPLHEAEIGRAHV